MESKTSKSQEEIWDAKEQLFEEVKNLTNEKKVEYLHEKAKLVIEKYFKDRTCNFQVH